MVTIVIPLFNKEKFIDKTIQSVLKQTFTKFELLIIDDGSTDDSLSLVREYSDPRIQIISIKNSGVSYARNIGIKKAKYDWIAFLDADDWWASTFLEEIFHALNIFPLNNIFAVGRSRVFQNKKERYNNEYLPKEGESKVINYFKVIAKYLPLINSSNVVIKKAIIKEKGYFNIGQRKHEDHDLWMRLCVDEDVVFVNKNLSFYCKTEANSLSSIHYESEDFFLYLNTILYVKKELTKTESIFFKSYYNKFILLTYIKYFVKYSRVEEIKLLKLIFEILTGKYFIAMKILKIVPFKKTYSILKLFKKNEY